MNKVEQRADSERLGYNFVTRDVTGIRDYIRALHSDVSASSPPLPGINSDQRRIHGSVWRGLNFLNTSCRFGFKQLHEYAIGYYRTSTFPRPTERASIPHFLYSIARQSSVGLFFQSERGSLNSGNPFLAERVAVGGFVPAVDRFVE